MIDFDKLVNALNEAGENSGEVNATIFYGWLNRNKYMDAVQENDELLLEKAIEFKEEYKQ